MTANLRNCRKKRNYPSWGRAMIGKHFNKQYGFTSRPYKCDECKNWHLTKESK